MSMEVVPQWVGKVNWRGQLGCYSGLTRVPWCRASLPSTGEHTLGLASTAGPRTWEQSLRQYWSRRPTQSGSWATDSQVDISQLQVLWEWPSSLQWQVSSRGLSLTHLIPAQSLWKLIDSILAQSRVVTSRENREVIRQIQGVRLRHTRCTGSELIDFSDYSSPLQLILQLSPSLLGEYNPSVAPWQAPDCTAPDLPFSFPHAMLILHFWPPAGSEPPLPAPTPACPGRWSWPSSWRGGLALLISARTGTLQRLVVLLMAG